MLFNLYLDEDTKRWESQMITSNFPGQLWVRNVIKMLMFAYEQVVMADDENTTQRALYELYKITNSYNFKISIEKTEVMAFVGKQPV
jgi:hypothetical protein